MNHPLRSPRTPIPLPPAQESTALTPPPTPQPQERPLLARGIPLVLLASALLAAGPAHAQEKVTYEDHVLPILRNKCVRCHNPDKQKADLNLSTFQGALKGSGNGPIVEGGDPDASKLFKVVAQTEEPFMPPSDKLPGPEMELIRKWIGGGLLETSGSKAIVSNKPKVSLALGSTSSFKPEGPPPMPVEVLALDPYVRTPRTSVSTALGTSPWSPLAALGSQRQILLYNTDTLQLEGIIPFPDGYPHDVKFSANGKLLVVGGGRGANLGLSTIWDVTTGEKILTVGDDYDAVLATDVSPDQKFVAHGGPDRLVRIFSTSSGQIVHKIKKHTDWITALCFSADGRYLATGDRAGGLHVWETAPGNPVCTLPGHRDRVTGIVWANTNILITASEDGTAKIWNTDEIREVKSWNAHGGGTLALSRNPAGMLVTCGRDQKATLWDPNGQRQRDFTFPGDLPSRAVLAHDSKRVIGSDWTGIVYVWNADDAKELGRLSLNPPSVADQFAAAQQKADQAQGNLAAAQAKLQSAENALTQAGAEAATEEQKKQVAEATKERDTANQALQAAKAELEREQTRLAFSEFFKAREAWRASTAKRDQLAAQIAAAQADLDKTRAQLAQTQALDLNAIKAAKIALVEKARQDQAGLQNQLRELETRKKQTQNAKAEADQEATQTQQLLDQRNTELKQAQTRFTELTPPAQAKRAEATQARTKLDEFIAAKQKPAEQKVAAATQALQQTLATLTQTESATTQTRERLKAQQPNLDLTLTAAEPAGRKVAEEKIAALTAMIQQIETAKTAQEKRLVEINNRVAQNLKNYLQTESDAQAAEAETAASAPGPEKQKRESLAREKRAQAHLAKAALDKSVTEEQQPALAKTAQLADLISPMLQEKAWLDHELALVALRKARDEAATAKTQAEQELQKVHSEVQQANQTFSDINLAAQKAETAAAEARSAADAKAEEVKQVQAKLTAAQQKSKEHQAAAQDLDRQEAALNQTLARATQDLAKAEADQANLEPAHAKALADLNQHAQTQAGTLASLQSELDKLTPSLATDQKRVEDLKQAYEARKAARAPKADA